MSTHNEIQTSENNSVYILFVDYQKHFTMFLGFCLTIVKAGYQLYCFVSLYVTLPGRCFRTNFISSAGIQPNRQKTFISLFFELSFFLVSLFFYFSSFSLSFFSAFLSVFPLFFSKCTFFVFAENSECIFEMRFQVHFLHKYTLQYIE